MDTKRRGAERGSDVVTADATTGMLVRKPAAEVFEAFVDPDITSRFWFSRGSARLAPGARVEWAWEMYGVSTMVEVKAFEPGKRLAIAWDEGPDATLVEWTFRPHGENATFVEIVNSGLRGTPEELVGKVADTTQGFCLVLAGLKAYLEHGIELRLVLDRYPKPPSET